MNLSSFIDELEELQKSVRKIHHGISKDNKVFQPFYPTKFMYTFFMFNTLYDIDWSKSLKEDKIIRNERRIERKKIASLIEFCFNDITFILKHMVNYRQTIINNLDNLELDYGHERQELEDELEDIIIDESKRGNINENYKRKMRRAVSSYLFGDKLLQKDAEIIANFIYDIRCNIFHGTKTFDMMQNRAQQRRLTIYTELIDSFCRLLFQKIKSLKKMNR